MQEKYEFKSSLIPSENADDSNLDDAVKTFLRECQAEKVTPPTIYKHLEENRMQFIDYNLPKSVCRVLSRAIKVRINLIENYRNFSLNHSKS